MILHIVSRRSLYRNVILSSRRAAVAALPGHQTFSTRLHFHVTDTRTRQTEQAEETTRWTHDADAQPGGYKSEIEALRHEQDKVVADNDLRPSTTSTRESSYQARNLPLSSLIPTPPNSTHYSQESFLAHSKRTGLNPSSTVFTGTRYEYLTLSCLRRLGIELANVGGTGDKGVDLVGFWHLPQWTRKSPTAIDREQVEEQGTEKIKVVVQCKRIAPTARATKSISPSVVRELEGAFRGAPPGWRGYGGDSVLGILVSTRAATKGVIEGMKRSERPLAWVLLEEFEEVEAANENIGGVERHEERPDEQEQQEDAVAATTPSAEYTLIKGRIRQILWNQKAREIGLEGLDVVKRHSLDEEDSGDEVVLMWNGTPVESLPEPVD